MQALAEAAGEVSREACDVPLGQHDPRSVFRPENLHARPVRSRARFSASVVGDDERDPLKTQAVAARARQALAPDECPESLAEIVAAIQALPSADQDLLRVNRRFSWR